MELAVVRSVMFSPKSLDLGVPSLDADHHYAAALLSVLEDCDGGLKKRFEQVLDRLTIFAHFHFQREEAVFRAANMPLDASHRADHEYFKAFIAEMRSEVAIEVSADKIHGVVDYINAWVSQHHADHDAKLRTITFDEEQVERIARTAVPPLSYLFDVY